MYIAFIPEGLQSNLSAEVPYSLAFEGNICFETAGILTVEGDLGDQIQASLLKAKSVVEDGGYDMNDVVRIEIWMVNMNGDVALLNKLYLEFLADAGVKFNLEDSIVYPTRQAIGVESLPHPMALFEVVFKVAILD